MTVVDDAHHLDADTVDALCAALGGAPAESVVVVAGRPGPDAGEMDRLVAGLTGDFAGRAHLLSLPPLPESDVGDLCRDLLGGEVGHELAHAVTQESGALPGAVVETVRAWAGSGRVAATGSGLALVRTSSSPTAAGQVRHLLAQTVDHLPAEELDVLHVVAALDRPVTVDGLVPLVDGPLPSVAAAAVGSERARPGVDRTWLRTTLDQLSDRSLLTSGPAGYAPRDALLRDALLHWLRPSSRHALHRRIAEQAVIPAAERISHWVHAGEPQLARAASVDACAEAMAQGRYEQALPHLRRLCDLTDDPGATPSDRLEAFEQLGDVCATLGRSQESRSAYAVAVEVARANLVEGGDRVRGKLRGAEERTVISRTAVAATSTAGATGSGGTTGSGAGATGSTAGTRPHDGHRGSRCPRSRGRARCCTSAPTPRPQPTSTGASRRHCRWPTRAPTWVDGPSSGSSWPAPCTSRGESSGPRTGAPPRRSR